MLQQALEHNPHRNTGRSTIQAFEAIARAMKAPRTRVYLHDHSGVPRGDEWLANKVKSIVARLDMQCFTFGESITGHYMVFGEFSGNGKKG